MTAPRRLLNVLLVSLLTAAALLALLAIPACGASIGVTIDPATGQPTFVIWWDPDRGVCFTEPTPGAVPVEVTLPAPPEAAPESIAHGDLQARARLRID